MNARLYFAAAKCIFCGRPTDWQCGGCKRYVCAATLCEVKHLLGAS